MPTTPYHEILDLPLGGWSLDEAQEAAIAEHLTLVKTISLRDEPYEFDDVRLYVRKADGAILYARDSGCSCPSPFEYAKVVDLKETTLAGLEALFTEYASDSYGRSLAAVLKDVRDARPALVAAGAK